MCIHVYCRDTYQTLQLKELGASTLELDVTAENTIAAAFKAIGR